MRASRLRLVVNNPDLPAPPPRARVVSVPITAPRGMCDGPGGVGCSQPWFVTCWGFRLCEMCFEEMASYRWPAS